MTLRLLATACGLLFSAAVFSQNLTADDYYERAKTLQTAGNLREAIAWYNLALEKDVNHEKALFNRAAAFLHSGQTEKARADYDRLLKNSKADSEAWELRGNCNFLLEEWKMALRDYEKAEKLTPSARLLTNMAVANFRLGTLAAAESCAEKALSLDPDYAEAWTAKGNVLFQQKAFEAAIMAYEQAARRMPGDAKIWQNLGAAYLHENRIEMAKNCFSKSIQFGATPEAYVNRANCFLYLENEEAALEDARAAYKMDLRAPGSYNIYGLVAARRGEFEKAARYFSEALGWDPKHPDALYNRGEVLFKMDDLEHAEADFSDFVDLQPESGKAWDGRARVRFARQDFEGACADFRKAQALQLPEASDEYGRSFCREERR